MAAPALRAVLALRDYVKGTNGGKPVRRSRCPGVIGLLFNRILVFIALFTGSAQRPRRRKSKPRRHAGLPMLLEQTAFASVADGTLDSGTRRARRLAGPLRSWS